MLRVSIALAAVVGFVASAQAATVVPTVYEAGHFFATPTLANGQVLRLLVDTGGGGINYWLQESTAARLGLQKASCPELADAPLVAAPEYQPDKGLPKPKTYCGAISALVPEDGIDTTMDGVVGSSYLPDHIWTFDYPRRTLSIEAPSWMPPNNAHALHMNLPATRKGQVRQSFPRIKVTVAGEDVDMLLDTGATARPTTEGLATMGTSVVKGEGTTSYATARLISHWHDAHPNWAVLDNADGLIGPKRAIRVPSVEIGGWAVGPVWFVERPNANFEQVMSSMMDGTVHGAIGANVLSSFRMTLDYVHATAWLSCVERCEASVPATK
jgi:predicted aspartyl protease